MGKCTNLQYTATRRSAAAAPLSASGPTWCSGPRGCKPRRTIPERRDLSHPYRDGASLYFTFISRSRAGEELEQWRAVKTAACEAIVAAEGTITHHHAVGRDHAPYMGAEVGELGVETLRTLKAKLDPAGIMNPGKLIA